MSLQGVKPQVVKLRELSQDSKLTPIVSVRVRERERKRARSRPDGSCSPYEMGSQAEEELLQF